MGFFSSLKHNQKEIIGLLQIATFLEYFNLMIFIYMGVLLNEIFLPPLDNYSSSFISAVTFACTHLFRTFGFVLFTIIGNYIGVRSTVSITNFIITSCSLIIATLPSYAEIGYTASIIMIICRILHGLACFSEIVGAEIYVSEITSPPLRSPAVALLIAISPIGGLIALLLISYSTNIAHHWQIVFWITAIISLIGANARNVLRETPDLVDMQHRLKRNLKKAHYEDVGKIAEAISQFSSTWKEKIDRKALIAFFLIECSHPVIFYLVFIYLGDFLRSNFHYSIPELINQNLIVNFFTVVSFCFFGILSYYFYPLRILKVMCGIFVVIVLFYPYMMSKFTSGTEILLLQILLIFFGLHTNAAFAIFLNHFPLFNRFNYVNALFLLSRAITFSTIILVTNYLLYPIDQRIFALILILISCGFYWGVNYFEKIEHKNNPT